MEGTFFAKPDEVYESHVVNYNIPPGLPCWSNNSYFLDKEKAIEMGAVPSLYCHWIIQHKTFVWNKNPYFYEPVAWLQWWIKNLFEPKNILLNGSFEVHTVGGYYKPTHTVYCYGE